MNRRMGWLLAIVVTSVAACGGGGEDAPGVASLDDTTTTAEPREPGGSVDTEQQLLAFVSCMRDQDVDLPDPSVDADGNVRLSPPADFELADAEALFDAAENCEAFLEGVSLGFTDVDLAAATDTLLEFAACMRENGYDLPDPDFSFALPGSDSVPPGGPFGDIDLEDPDFEAAFTQCQDFIFDLGVAGS